MSCLLAGRAPGAKHQGKQTPHEPQKFSLKKVYRNLQSLVKVARKKRFSNLRPASHHCPKLAGRGVLISSHSQIINACSLSVSPTKQRKLYHQSREAPAKQPSHSLLIQALARAGSGKLMAPSAGKLAALIEQGHRNLRTRQPYTNASGEWEVPREMYEHSCCTAQKSHCQTKNRNTQCGPEGFQPPLPETLVQ